MEFASRTNVRHPKVHIYETLEDMLYNTDSDSDIPELPAPPIKVEDIKGCQDLLIFIDYIKAYKAYRKNKTFKYLIKVEDPLRELNRMVGMCEIKRTIADQVLYYSKMLAKGRGKLEGEVITKLNTAIYGDPGCGKTTIAHLIGKIYRKLGIVKNDKFIIGRRDNMIGKYLGQTAPKTRDTIKSASGGILFLDEVYQFGSAGSGNKDSYAKEVADTVNQYITENPGDVVFIVAGYRDQVKACWFAQNAGLERRFKWSYSIKAYGEKELLQIFYTQAKRLGYEIKADALALPTTSQSVVPEETTIKKNKRRRSIVIPLSAGEKFFKEHKQHFKYGGGDTETFLEKCIIINEKRTIVETWDEHKITDLDIEKGLVEYLKYTEDRKPPSDEIDKEMRDRLYN